ncbi:MAG: Gfo/Idh/MocA family oxidoreductase [Ruminococcaceae bacterium]|nr:Gfo/Idh/MocA family oxidoreductase [Oscillospiraceae bacterium]
MSTLLKAAILGCGGISKTHIDAIKKNDLADIVALCDIREDRLASNAALCPEAETFSDYKELLEKVDCDVVHICTPHYLHEEMAIAAMRAGHDVYLEKPAAMLPEGARNILKVSRETGKKVCVSFQNRLINSTVSAKSIIESGEIGKLLGLKGIVTWDRGGAYYTESGWRGTWEKEGGGVLMNQSIHTIDLLYYLGGKIERVEGSVALRKNKGTIEVEDTAEATFWYENGATAIFYATNCHAMSSPVEIEIVGEKGSLLIRENTLYRRNHQDGSLEKVSENSSLAVGKSVWGHGHAIMIGNFYEAVKGNDALYCDIEDAIVSLEIIQAIYATSKNKLK